MLAYPVAYWIAFYAGRFKSVVLFLLLLPFFISFVIRTVAWSFILSDNGIIFGTLKDIGLLPESYRVLGTTRRRSSRGSPTTSCRSRSSRCTSRWSRSTPG